MKNYFKILIIAVALTYGCNTANQQNDHVHGEDTHMHEGDNHDHMGGTQDHQHEQESFTMENDTTKTGEHDHAHDDGTEHTH